MMRKFAQLLLAGCLLVLPAAAQRGGHGGGGGGFHGGMGGGGFRGGMGGGWRGGGFGPGFRGGWRGGGWRWRGGGWGWRGGGWGPWGGYYPGVYFGPGWGWSYPYSSPYDAAGYGYSMAQPASCPQVNGAPLYQIKLTYQNNVYLAQKYWYTPGTLNFITVQGEENKTPIDTIDPVTFQLNQSCGMNFTLPPGRN